MPDLKAQARHMSDVVHEDLCKARQIGAVLKESLRGRACSPLFS